jgi:hypothetical protein
MSNAKLYSKFLEQIMWGYATFTGHAPWRADMPQIRTIAARLVVDQPNAKVVSVTVKDGVVEVGVAPPDERSFAV